MVTLTCSLSTLQIPSILSICRNYGYFNIQHAPVFPTERWAMTLQVFKFDFRMLTFIKAGPQEQVLVISKQSFSEFGTNQLKHSKPGTLGGSWLSGTRVSFLLSRLGDTEFTVGGGLNSDNPVRQCPFKRSAVHWTHIPCYICTGRVLNIVLDRELGNSKMDFVSSDSMIQTPDSLKILEDSYVVAADDFIFWVINWFYFLINRVIN